MITLRPPETISGLFAKLEEAERTSRVWCADGFIAEQDDLAARVRGELRRRRLARVARMIARRLGLTSDNSY